MKVAFIGDVSEIGRVYGGGRRHAIEARAEVLPGVVASTDLDERLGELENTDAIFSTWGMPRMTPGQLERMPALKAVFYAAGAVEYFAGPLLDRGISVSSAWHANAVPVAEFTLSQILLSLKGYFRNARECADRRGNGQGCFRGPGAYGETIALLGAGAIGTKLIELLRPFRLDICVFDPFMTQERADSLGVRKATLEAAFADGYVVSNHLADNPGTAGLITRDLLCAMRPGSTFINTGRGRTVLHGDLVEFLRERPDVTALLDVTDPEPLPEGHPLWDLPNVGLTSHIAGSIGDEVCRLADYAIEEFDRFARGEELRYRVVTLG